MLDCCPTLSYALHAQNLLFFIAFPLPFNSFYCKHEQYRNLTFIRHLLEGHSLSISVRTAFIVNNSHWEKSLSWSNLNLLDLNENHVCPFHHEEKHLFLLLIIPIWPRKEAAICPHPIQACGGRHWRTWQPIGHISPTGRVTVLSSPNLSFLHSLLFPVLLSAPTYTKTHPRPLPVGTLGPGNLQRKKTEALLWPKVGTHPLTQSSCVRGGEVGEERCWSDCCNTSALCSPWDRSSLRASAKGRRRWWS